jgi:ribosomal protein S18 acetylase RimI-like enzyme
VRIRRAGPDDASSIAGVYVRSWKGAYPGLIPQTYLDALHAEERVSGWEETLANAAWPQRGVIVLLGPAAPDGEVEGPITGFVSFGPTRDDDPGTAPDAETVGEIVTFYLDPAAFGSGGADLLMSAALVALRAAGFTTAMLWVLGTNARARRFYERGGWRPDGTSKVHDWGAFVATDVRYVIDVPSGLGVPT